MANEKERFQLKRVALGALAGAGTTLGLNVAVYLLSTALGVDFAIQQNPAAPPAPITLGNVVGASILPAFFAGGVLMLLGRFTAKARRTFVIIAGVFALLSLGGPATVPGASGGTRIALMAMHLLSAIAISGWLLRSTSTAERAVAEPAGT